MKFVSFETGQLKTSKFLHGIFISFSLLAGSLFSPQAVADPYSFAIGDAGRALLVQSIENYSGSTASLVFHHRFLNCGATAFGPNCLKDREQVKLVRSKLENRVYWAQERGSLRDKLPIVMTNSNERFSPGPFFIAQPLVLRDRGKEYRMLMLTYVSYQRAPYRGSYTELLQAKRAWLFDEHQGELDQKTVIKYAEDAKANRGVHLKLKFVKIGHRREHSVQKLEEMAVQPASINHRKLHQHLSWALDCSRQNAVDFELLSCAEARNRVKAVFGEFIDEVARQRDPDYQWSYLQMSNEKSRHMADPMLAPILAKYSTTSTDPLIRVCSTRREIASYGVLESNVRMVLGDERLRTPICQIALESIWHHDGSSLRSPARRKSLRLTKRRITFLIGMRWRESVLAAVPSRMKLNPEDPDYLGADDIRAITTSLIHSPLIKTRYVYEFMRGVSYAKDKVVVESLIRLAAHGGPKGIDLMFEILPYHKEYLSAEHGQHLKELGKAWPPFSEMNSGEIRSTWIQRATEYIKLLEKTPGPQALEAGLEFALIHLPFEDFDPRIAALVKDRLEDWDQRHTDVLRKWLQPYGQPIGIPEVYYFYGRNDWLRKRPRGWLLRKMRIALKDAGKWDESLWKE